MDYTPLTELEIGHHGYKIRCRLARIWDSTNPALQDRLISVDFMLVDDKGTSIQGSMRKEDSARIRELLDEGKVYTIANFVVGSCKKSYKVCNNQVMIRIGTWTIIKEVLDSGSEIPLNVFEFADMKMLDSRLYNDILLTDMMGHLISIGKLVKIHINGREVWKKDLVIQTLDLEIIPVTLWGAVAQKFDHANPSNVANKEPVVAICTSMTVRAYKANTTLSSTSATKIYLDLDIAEVAYFRSRIIFPKEGGVSSLPEEHTVNPVKDYDQQEKTISQLLEQGAFLYGDTKSICSALITDIDTSRGWWYNACAKCKSSVGGNGEGFSCRRCGPTGSLPMPWYKLNLGVTDGTASAKFLLFGKYVERLINIPASTLCNLPGSNRTVLPAVMEELRGKKFRFTVKAGDHANCTFIVSQVTRCEEIPDSNYATKKGKEKVNLSSTEVNPKDEQQQKKQDIKVVYLFDNNEVLANLACKRKRITGPRGIEQEKDN